MATVTPLINAHCKLGENPLWNIDDQCIYWEDIDFKQVHKFDPKTGTHTVIYDETHVEGGQKVGGFTFQADGTLLLFRERDLAVLKADGSVSVLVEYTDDTMVRFNDVIADPAGRVYAGTIGTSEETGGLYRVDLDGTITKLWAGTEISNGMAFTADHKTMYWTDSTASTIFRAPYNEETGEIGERSVFYKAPEEQGTTDGLTIDTNDHIWSARWDGNAIIHHDPTDGHVIDKIEIPVKNVTSVCFGGANLDEFFITTAHSDKPTELDGSLYHCVPGVNGNAEFRSRIKI